MDFTELKESNSRGGREAANKASPRNLQFMIVDTVNLRSTDANDIMIVYKECIMERERGKVLYLYETEEKSNYLRGK